MERTDEDLMDLVAQGSHVAFEALVLRHLRRAHALAFRLAASPAEAEEQVQEAFARLWVHARTWQRGRASFSTWFTRILINACMDTHRRRRPTVEMTEDLPDHAPHAGQALERRRMEAEVRRAVLALPARQRVAVVLCYYDQISNREAAEMMGVSVKALETLLVRARRALRRALGSWMDEEERLHAGR